MQNAELKDLIAACLAAVAYDPRVTVEECRHGLLTGTILLTPGDLSQAAHNLMHAAPKMALPQELRFEIRYQDDGDDGEFLVALEDQWKRDARPSPVELVMAVEFAAVELFWSQPAMILPRPTHPAPRRMQ